MTGAKPPLNLAPEGGRPKPPKPGIIGIDKTIYVHLLGLMWFAIVRVPDYTEQPTKEDLEHHQTAEGIKRA